MKSCPAFKSKGNHSDPGGKFLEALEKNAPKTSKQKAAAIAQIIKTHKPLWIDSTIKNRDHATHRGTLETKVKVNSGLVNAPITGFNFETFFDNNNLAKLNQSIAQNFIQFIQEILLEIIKE